MELKIGNGYDIHQLVPGRKLILGGVLIPSHKGLLGHSDADCLLHSISDALLGALSLPNIGQIFPNTAPQYRDISSKRILAYASEAVAKENYRILNIDTVIVAETPHLSPYVETMKSSIAEILNIEPKRIGIKATTHEKLDAIGREEAIACYAVCLLVQDS